jgi:hypothetical protein
MPQAKSSMRKAMARFESTCATPTLASRAVAAAKQAESSAHPIQLMRNITRTTCGGADAFGRLRFVVSHLRHKNKDVPKVGHPYSMKRRGHPGILVSHPCARKTAHGWGTELFVSSSPPVTRRRGSGCSR